MILSRACHWEKQTQRQQPMLQDSVYPSKYPCKQQAGSSLLQSEGSHH